MTVRTFKQIPKPYLAYVKAGLASIKAKPATTLPDVVYRVEKLRINSAHLAAYNRVIGVKTTTTLPPVYLGALTMPLQLVMMTEEPFPFKVIGIVHISSEIEQYRPIRADERLTIEMRYGQLTPHDKGQQFEVLTTAQVDGQIVWESTTVYLVVNAKKSAQSTAPLTTNARLVQREGDLKRQFAVPENMGRRYGAVSGDINLIHLHALPAKLFGFKKAIAHGMWSEARALGLLEGHFGPFADHFRVTAQFKRPIFLPAEVKLTAAAEGNNIDFELIDDKQGKPHLTGQVIALGT